MWIFWEFDLDSENRWPLVNITAEHSLQLLFRSMKWVDFSTAFAPFFWPCFGGTLLRLRPLLPEIDGIEVYKSLKMSGCTIYSIWQGNWSVISCVSQNLVKKPCHSEISQDRSIVRYSDIPNEFDTFSPVSLQPQVNTRICLSWLVGSVEKNPEWNSHLDTVGGRSPASIEVGAFIP